MASRQAEVMRMGRIAYWRQVAEDQYGRAGIDAVGRLVFQRLMRPMPMTDPGQCEKEERKPFNCPPDGKGPALDEIAPEKAEERPATSRRSPQNARLRRMLSPRARTPQIGEAKTIER